ncbi:MAG: G8 domain-containing protein [Planctomycetaceae bacterium]
MLFNKRSWLRWGWISGVASRPARRRTQNRTWNLETLEVRTLLSGTALTPAELAAITARVQALKVDQFKTLQPTEVPFLTAAQIQSITTSKQLNAISEPARGAFSADQVRQLSVGKTGLLGLTPGQIEALTVAQIQSLKVADFPLLRPSQIPSLTTVQIKTINNDRLLRALPEADRAALTADQIKQLKIADVGLSLLTDPQIEALTVAQIQTLKPKDIAQLLAWQTASLTAAQRTAYAGVVANATAPATQQVGNLTVGQIRAVQPWEFNHLTAAQVPFLTSQQIGRASGSWPFVSMSEASRGALTAGQVRSLMVGSTGIDFLNSAQRGFVSVVQIQALNYWDFPDLSPSQITSLTVDQLASIPGAWWFEQIPANVRAALTATQVKALNVAAVGLDGLTTGQIGQLSVAQIQAVSKWDFDRLSASQIVSLTVSQIGLIDNEWWFGQWPADVRAALKPVQIQALRVEDVGIGLLTTNQVKQLTTAQVQRLHFDDFKYLTASQTPLLTAGQLQSIPNGWWFEQISAPARAALTADQVRSLNVAEVGLGGLTVSQRGMISQAQVQSLEYDNFRYLNATQTPWLTAEQLASIDNSWWFGQIPAPARAALTATQVQALDIEDIGLEGLTVIQVNALTPDQIHEVEYHDFDHLTPTQAPHLTVEQLASIDNGWWFGQMPDDARAVLNATQIQALNIELVGLDELTDSQVGWLSLDQIHDVEYSDFDHLHVDQIDDLTTTQIATIPNCWYFEQIPEDVRAGLTVEQIQALNTAEVTVNHLTSTQRDHLTVTQILSIDEAYYFRFLNAEQVTHLTPDQMSLFENEWQFHQLSDEAQAALSRAQLLAMPEHVHAQMLDLDAGLFSPEGHSDGHDHDHDTPTPVPTPAPTTGPHLDDPAKRSEHLALFALVPREAATFVTIASGDWNNSATWRNGQIPNGAAQVLVSAGHTVTFDAVQTNAMRWVRVDGTLQFKTNIDTQLLVDTLVVDAAGTLRIGSAAAPIAAGVAARIVIADNGRNIDQAWDPLQLSRGVISHGTIEMHGETVTPFVSLNGVRRNAIQLTLDSIPTNWRVGDRLVLTGTTTDISAKQDEELRLVAINGNTITIDSDDDLAGNQGLQFNHMPPEGFGLKVYIADMNRNVVIMSQNPAITQHRGHVMFMHSNKVHVENVGFYGLGRTDKRNPINDPVFGTDGQLLATTGLNPRGRYAVHFHRTGVDGSKTPAHISGSAVVDSPGWGFVNHDSNVNMLDNVAFNVQGASFVTEIGNEIGSMVRNLSIRSEGSGDGLEDRQDIFDFGHGGHGFWLQGPGVEVVDNIAASNAEAGIIFFTTSSEAEFDAANLDDPSLAAGRDSVPVGTVPLKRVDGNIAFASGTGLETWFHLTHMNDGQSYIDNTTTWNTGGRGFFNPYTGRTTIRNATVLGKMNGHGVWGTAFDRNDVTNNMTYENVHAEGWEVGIDVAVNRATVIRDGVFRAVRAIEISSTEDALRTVDIIGDPQFLPLTAQQLGDRQQFEIFLNGEINLRNRDIETYFSPDIVRLGTVRFNNHQVYYFKQAANYVPFPASATETLSWLPPEIVGKTNAELWELFGIAPGGVVAPEDAVIVEGINGLVGSQATYLPDLELHSDKYTNKPNNYTLSYENARGDVITERNTTPIREGWNLLTRQIDGNTRTFFVYGDTKAPEFILDPRTDLRVNPQGLQFGIVIRGTVRDDSFGEMHFRREFKDLSSRPIKTDASGKRYLDITFNIRDLAGNTTSISLKVFLDPTVPIQPGTGQRDLPPREVPRTLAELLEYYYLTGQ